MRALFGPVLHRGEENRTNLLADLLGDLSEWPQRGGKVHWLRAHIEQASRGCVGTPPASSGDDVSCLLLITALLGYGGGMVSIREEHALPLFRVSAFQVLSRWALSLRALAVVWAISIALSLSGQAVAQPVLPDEVVAPSLPGEDGEVAPEPDIVEAGEEKSPEERIELLEDKLYELEARLSRAEQSKDVDVPITFSGYVDFGVFAPFGNRGVGWVQDFGNRQFPEYQGRYGWVFLGDILATAVNARGEPADLGDAPGASDRFDSINSGGAAGFVVNEVNVGTTVGLSPHLLLRTSLNLAPRTGSHFDLGDFVDIDLAEAEWVVSDTPNISLFAGKTLPVFGIEYKTRKSDQRFGITPSLVSRYTSGSQLGLKIRGKFFSDWLIVAAALTNGSSTVESFHFQSEIDTNTGKTFNGRIALHIPFSDLTEALSGHTLEIGLSGEAGPQDRSADNDGVFWLVGVDFEFKSTSYALRGQWMRGHSPGGDNPGGAPVDDVWGLRLKDSGYVEFNWMITPILGVMVRGGLRNALVTLGEERAYLTKSWRLTLGGRAVLSRHVAFRAEYLKNGEFGGVESIPNDVAVGSLVLSY
ncbi:MAG: hypothetical protein H6729_14945 [Deltaproteobacteria bacterium]|nr:hypothetical protein [Deltaproteobacteria bacterium]